MRCGKVHTQNTPCMGACFEREAAFSSNQTMYLSTQANTVDTLTVPAYLMYLIKCFSHVASYYLLLTPQFSDRMDRDQGHSGTTYHISGTQRKR